VQKPHFADYKQYQNDLKSLSSLYQNVLDIRLMGGEPLLNPELSKFIIATREIFPLANISIVTNGLIIPKTDEHLFEIMVNCKCIFHISVYEPTHSILDKIQETLKKYNVQWQFNTTIIPIESFYKKITFEPINDPVKSHKYCKCRECHFLCNGYLYPCVFPAKKHILEKYFDIKFENLDINKVRVNLHNTDLSGWDINNIIKKPNEACKFCYIGEERFKWESCSNKNAMLEDWIVNNYCNSNLK
jgi:molybdenum cofactor biosynthesis enzyme MoaA